MLLTYSGKSHHNCRPTYSFYILSLEFPSVVMVTNVLQIYLHAILNGLGYSPCMLQTQCSFTRISPFFENLGEYSVIRLISSRSVRFVINVLIAKSYNIYIYIYIHISCLPFFPCIEYYHQVEPQIGAQVLLSRKLIHVEDGLNHFTISLCHSNASARVQRHEKRSVSNEESSSKLSIRYFN